jgi:hypothetical protein
MGFGVNAITDIVVKVVFKEQTVGSYSYKT